jgi:hypothetical protein
MLSMQPAVLYSEIQAQRNGGPCQFLIKSMTDVTFRYFHTWQNKRFQRLTAEYFIQSGQQCNIATPSMFQSPHKASPRGYKHLQTRPYVCMSMLMCLIPYLSFNSANNNLCALYTRCRKLNKSRVISFSPFA